MKKLSVIISIVALLLAWTACCLAYTYPTIVLDGRQLDIPVPAIDEHGRTMVPVRAFFEETGAAVSWEEDTQTITVTTTEKEIKLTIGQTTANVNGTVVDLDAPPQVLDGRIVAPLRFVAEAMGATASWNTETQEINIQTAVPSSPGQTPPASPDTAPQPDSNGPQTAPPPNDNKLPLHYINPELSPYLVILFLAALLVIAMVVRRSRGKAPKQIGSEEAAASSEAAAAGEAAVFDEATAFSEAVAPEEAEPPAPIYDPVEGQGDVPGELKTHEEVQENLSSVYQETAAASDAGYRTDTGSKEEPPTVSGHEAVRAGAAPIEAAGDREDLLIAANQGETQAKTAPARDQAQTDHDQETIAAYYRKGIEMIQQQNWTEARLALVYPSIVQHLDSEFLGYYIEALEQYQESQKPDAADPYWASVMADYYCRKIPDDYEGVFKEEILALKSACRINLAQQMQNLGM